MARGASPCDRVLVRIRSDGFLRGVLDFGWGGGEIEGIPAQD